MKQWKLQNTVWVYVEKKGDISNQWFNIVCRPMVEKTSWMQDSPHTSLKPQKFLRKILENSFIISFTTLNPEMIKQLIDKVNS